MDKLLQVSSDWPTLPTIHGAGLFVQRHHTSAGYFQDSCPFRREFFPRHGLAGKRLPSLNFQMRSTRSPEPITSLDRKILAASFGYACSGNKSNTSSLFSVPEDTG